MGQLTIRARYPDDDTDPVSCDSVRLLLRDGYYGIHSGHVRAVLALGTGRVTASEGGKEVFSLDVDGGFASVNNDEIVLLLR